MKNKKRGFAQGAFGEGSVMAQAFPYLLLAFACLFFCWLFVLRHGVFGSRVDWVNQHSVLPDYFRKRFYETGNILPDFSWNIGGGQNIYNFSYYGLFSPVVLLSFLFPFIRMDIYIMISSMLCYTAAVLLFYAFLRRRELPGSAALGASLFFALASSFIYHSYNQLMFVNYMPFLCLALLGTDDYLGGKKRGWLICGVTGMILTSFYFSIGGMAALCLYAVSEYLGRTERVELVPLLKTGAGYVWNLLHSILLAGILLVPTAVSVFSSRQEGVTEGQAIEILSFVPSKILYSPYGMGLSVLAVAALLGGVVCAAGWRGRVMPAALCAVFAIPAVGFLLNGGLYEKGKVFIPFLPLVCLQCARYCARGARSVLSLVLPWALTGVLFVYAEFNSSLGWEWAWVDFGVSCLAFILSAVLSRFLCAGRRCAGKALPSLALFAACLALVFFNLSMNEERERMFTREEYAEVMDSGRQDKIERVLDGDKSFYRLDVLSDDTANHNNLNRLADIRQNITSMYSSCYNQEYWNFRRDTFDINEPLRNNMMQTVTDNPCFLQFMGVRYLLSDRQPAGYVPCGEADVYYNPLAAPVLYVTDQVIPEEEYRALDFPSNQTALLWAASAGRDASGEVFRGQGTGEGRPPEMAACGFTLPECSGPELTVVETADGYEVEAASETEIQAEIQAGRGAGGDDLFALAFDVENGNPNRDMYIRVNRQTNKLTAVTHDYANQNTNFAYMTTKGAEDRTVSVALGPGKYKITGIRAFTGRLDEMQNRELYQSPVDVDLRQGLDDGLAGSVDALRDGCLVTSIPYDENFTLELDGREIEKIRVNTAFLGAEVPAGKHELCITYSAPGKAAGGLLSLAGIAILAGTAVYSRYRHHR